MPAAAVIPAPIAYMNVVAVKTLVVETTLLLAWVFDSARLGHFCGLRRCNGTYLP